MMMTKKEKKRVPELRFEGFEGEWEEKKLGKLTSKVGSGSTPRGGVDVYTTTGIPFIRSQNVLDNQLLLDETHIPESVHERMAGSTVLPNDVLLNITGGSIGRSCVVPSNGFSEGNVNQHVSIIRLKKDSPHFLQALLSSHRGQNLIYQGMTGSGREGLNFQSIRGFKINIPKPEEQQKIATFLTSIDTRIQLLEKKKTLLEQYKKGVMQRIFKQEVRFKRDDGEEFSEWEEKKLGDIAQITTGKLNANAMVENGAYRFYTCAKEYYRIDNFAFHTEALLISGNGANVGYIHYYRGKFNAYQRTYVLDKFTENIFYIKYYLEEHLSARIEREKKDGNTPYIVLGTLKDMKIKIPCLAEQTKIAHFLTSLDRKIAVMEQQIVGTKEWKKGLLQKMFV